AGAAGSNCQISLVIETLMVKPPMTMSLLLNTTADPGSVFAVAGHGSVVATHRRRRRRRPRGRSADAEDVRLAAIGEHAARHVVDLVGRERRGLRRPHAGRRV